MAKDIDWDAGVLTPPPGQADATDWDSGVMSPPPKRTLGSDARNALMQGAQQLPGVATGLADIPAGALGFDRPFSRAADKLGTITRFQPSQWAKDRESQYSDETQAAKANIDRAWEDPNTGAADIAGAYVQNPRGSAMQILRSVPSMLAGGVAGRVVGGVAGIASAPARAAIGEGTVMAGSTMDQIDTSVDPQRAAAAAAGTGVVGGAVSGLAGRAASRLGFGDIDQAIAGGATGRTASMPLRARIPAGIVQEGLVEEGTQSAVETAAQNWAERKPLTEGMARNVTEGVIAGGVMGGGFAALPQRSLAPDTQPGQQQPAQELGDVPDLQATPPAASVPQAAPTWIDALRDQQDELPPDRAAYFDEELPARAQVAEDYWRSGAWQAQREAMRARGAPTEEEFGLDRDFRTLTSDDPATLPELRERALSRLWDRLDDEFSDFQVDRVQQPTQRPSEAMGIDPAAGPLSRAAATAVDSQPDRLSPEEVRGFNNAYRREVPDPLGELQAQVRAGTEFTTPEQAQGIRREIEDAWLQSNVADEAAQVGQAEAAPAAPPSNEPFGDPTAGVDGRLRERRIMSSLQEVIDDPAGNALQAFSRINGAMKLIGEVPLSGEERARVRRVLDAQAAFTGRTEQAPLPSTAPAPMGDLFAQNEAMETLIPERRAEAGVSEKFPVRAAAAPTPAAAFPDYESAKAFIDEQRRAGGTRMQALPLPRPDGTFGLALRGTPDYQVAQFDQRERRQRAAGVLDGDVLTKAGEIFSPKQKGHARMVARRTGPGYAVVPVTGGFVVRRSAVPNPAPDAVPAQAVQATGGDPEAGGAPGPSGRSNTVAAELTAPAADAQAAAEDAPAAVEVPAGLARVRAARAARQTIAPASDTPATAPITDLGEKIGGARKDTAARGASAPAPRRATDDDRPAWARRFKISEIASSTTPGEQGRWSIYDSRTQDRLGQPRQLTRQTFATQDAAEAALPLLAVAQKHRVVSAGSGKFEIWREVSDRKRVKIVDQTFDSREAALLHMTQNAVAIIETNTTFGEADLPVPDNKRREGPARRQGDVDGQAFRDTFGFRGVEFGNWNNQAERQELMNEAYDGLLDLAEVVGIPPKAISLNGDLALAFGARGQGLSSARAHYEQQRAVINLTKMKGAGALAHEWFHALDHYFGRQDGKAAAKWTTQADGTRTLQAQGGAADMASGGMRGDRSGVRAEVREAYQHVMRTLATKAERFVQDTARAERFVAQSREDVAQRLDSIRKDLASEKTYGKRFTKPATAEQLAAFDALAKPIVDGIALDTEMRPTSGKLSGLRWSNDALEQISAIYKAVRGRSGFDATDRRGVLDNLRSDMARYSQRMKMLADAQQSTSAERRAPTDFAMDARSLDQGRGTDYWTTPHEMAARAFQGFVEDKITAGEGRSPFLNHAPENAGLLTPWGWKRPYPAGQERVAINEALQALVGVLQTRETDDGVALFRRTTGAGPQAPFAAAAQRIAASWANGPEVIVAANLQDPVLPARIRQTDSAQRAGGATGAPQAVYFGGRVYLIADQIRSERDAATALFHEALGHHGLRAVFGSALDPVLDQVATLRRADVQAKATEYGLDLSVPARRLQAAEEVLAEMAQTRPEIGWVQRAVAAIRTWMRENLPGLSGLRLSNAEIVRSFLAPARGFVERGGQRGADARVEPAFSRTAATGQVVTDLKRRAGNTLADYRHLALSTLGRRQLVDLYGQDLPQLQAYSDLVQRMDADKNESGAEADQIATAWGKLKDERQLAELMHDATLAQIDPAKPLLAGDSAAAHQALKARFDALTPEARKVYLEARDTYLRHHEAVRSAIRERIERSAIRGQRKVDLLRQMDDEFFKAIKGVYFPLARFGQYLVIVRDSNGKAINVSRAETLNEAEALRHVLRRAYPTAMVGKVIKAKDFNAGRDAVGRGFMETLFKELGARDMDEKQKAELEDVLGQLYLSALPDLSWAKHGIHRKGTPGFSQDARRAFAQNVFHGARYLAKVRYSDLLENELADMQKTVDALGQADGFDPVQAQQVVDEMVKRHDSMMNPNTSPLSTALTSLGFVFHLGLSPASAMVNLTQTAFVALPIMGAKWGFAKSSAALLKASKQAATSRNDISGSLTAQEREAFDEAVRSGVIDVTMAHDLAGISQGEDAKVSWKLRPVMKWASFLFHHAEKFNRQVTFVAAYRLAREAGAGHQMAYREAVKATYDGHFDYSAGNRPRLMQGNVARVVLLFKQYAQNMVYTLSRQAFLAVKAEKPEDRAEARKALGGLLAMHAAGAGVLGLPLVSTLLAAASAVGGSDDEPWDAEVALRNMLADALGQKPAEVLARGLSRLTPSDISGRVGLDNLILPDLQEGLEGQRLGESAMAAALGPVAGIGIMALKGMQEIAGGNWARGLEAMAPSVLRGPLKAVRYADEGVVDKTGKAVLADVDGLGILGQALGFSPSDVRLAYEGKSAIYQADQRLVRRRAALMRQFSMAKVQGDEEAAQEAQADIQGFNTANPERRITAMNLAASIRMRRRQIEEAQQGVYLPKARRDAVGEGRFSMERG